MKRVAIVILNIYFVANYSTLVEAEYKVTAEQINISYETEPLQPMIQISKHLRVLQGSSYDVINSRDELHGGVVIEIKKVGEGKFEATVTKPGEKSEKIFFSEQEESDMKQGIKELLGVAEHIEGGTKKIGSGFVESYKCDVFSETYEIRGVQFIRRYWVADDPLIRKAFDEIQSYTLIKFEDNEFLFKGFILKNIKVEKVERTNNSVYPK